MAYQNEAVQFGWQAALYLGEADTSKIATHMEEEKLEKVQQCDVVNEQIIADGGAEDEGLADEGEAWTKKTRQRRRKKKEKKEKPQYPDPQEP